MRNAFIYPLFYTKDRTPFVFWDADHEQLLIRHGKKLTIIYYDEATCLSCIKPLRYRQSASVTEEMIYNGNGKIVASYLPNLDCLVIKRDGDILSFSAPKRPIGYKDCTVDKLTIPLFVKSPE